MALLGNFNTKNNMNGIQHDKIVNLCRTLQEGCSIHAKHEGAYVRLEERKGGHLMRCFLVHPSHGQSITDTLLDIGAICQDERVSLQNG